MKSPEVLEILQRARIAKLREQCGVTPRPRHPLPPREQKIVDWFRAELQAAYAELRDADKAERAALAKLAPVLERYKKNGRDQTD